MVKRDWQPKKLKRVRKHGFMSRNATKKGRDVMKRRRLTGRRKLSVTSSGK
ncbi:MAG: 50S ribosomal protein L34 [Candidatus Amesbacteria bacterium]|nr:50S ribosomal protein L34 [Candidatus Amesbacteria bacterium]